MTDEFNEQLELLGDHLDGLDEALDKADDFIDQVEDNFESLNGDLECDIDEMDFEDPSDEDLKDLELYPEDVEDLENQLTALEAKNLRAEAKAQKNLDRIEEHFEAKMAEYRENVDDALIKTRGCMARARKIYAKIKAAGKSDSKSEPKPDPDSDDEL